MTKKLRVGISIGDSNSIGIELILKTFQNKDIFEYFTPVIFASSKLLTYHKKSCSIDGNIFFNNVLTAKEILNDKFNVVNLWKENIKVSFGKYTEESRKAAIISLEKSTEAINDNLIDILIQLPLNKDIFNGGGLDFENLDNYFRNNLRVKLISIYVDNDFKTFSLSNKFDYLENKILWTEKVLKDNFSIERPKISLILDDDFNENINFKIIKENLQSKKVLFFGPYKKSEFFEECMYDKFDLVLTANDELLNIFREKDILREDYTFVLYMNETKVIVGIDQGLGYNIAGKGNARESSLRNAIFSAKQVYNTIKENKELKINVLKKANIKDISNVDEDIFTQ